MQINPFPYFQINLINLPRRINFYTNSKRSSKLNLDSIQNDIETIGG